MIFKAVMQNILDDYETEEPPPNRAVLACLRWVADVEDVIAEVQAEDPELKSICVSDMRSVSLVFQSSIGHRATFCFTPDQRVRVTSHLENNAIKVCEFKRSHVGYAVSRIRRLTKRLKTSAADYQPEYQRGYYLAHRGKDRAKKRAELEAATGQWEELLKESRRLVQRESERQWREAHSEEYRASRNASRKRNREAINARGRKRYATDPDFRASRAAVMKAYALRKKQKEIGGTHES